MKIVLIEDVKNVGKAGEIVDVKAGFGRNFLVKNNKGLPGTKENIEKAKQVQAALAAKQAAERAEAEAMAARIKDTTLIIKEKASDDGKLFGSVTNKDIATALEAQKDIKVDKRKITLNAPIRNVGRAEVHVKPYAGIDVSLTVVVEAQ